MFEWLTAAFFALGIWLAANGVQPSYLVGGFFGGMVRAALSKTGSKWEKILSGFIGAILAAYLTPILVTLVSAFVVIPATSLSFAVGLIGMSFCEAVLAIGKDYRDHPGKLKADIRSFLLRMLEKRD